MADGERVLSERDLNRALLARQLLLERARSPLPRTLERIAGIQAQYAPSMYVGLWSRLEGFEREQLTRALKRRSVVQGTLMRATIHLVSARDYWPFAAGIRKARRESWLRAPIHEMSARQLATAGRATERALRNGPLSAKELEELLRERPGRVSAWRNGVNVWLDLVRVPPSGTWERRRADLYGLAEEWLSPEEATEAEGIELLVRRYLQGFGPAAPTEVADWAGLPVKAVRPVLERVAPRRFRAEDGTELFDLPRAPLPDPETPAPVRLLPVWDATLLAHARRTGILPEKHRSKVFNVRTPQSVNTFLVDGAVAGTWRYERGRVKLAPFGRLDRATRRELDSEAGRLAALYA
jgi:hypothetical protein